jgi:hypothetical protein
MGFFLRVQQTIYVNAVALSNNFLFTGNALTGRMIQDVKPPSCGSCCGFRERRDLMMAPLGRPTSVAPATLLMVVNLTVKPGWSVCVKSKGVSFVKNGTSSTVPTSARAICRP